MIATEEDVRAAYRLLLGREPEPRGLQHFVAWVSTSRATPLQLADQFFRSLEFRTRRAPPANLQQNASSSGLVKVEVGAYSVFASATDALISAGVIHGQNYEPHVMELFSQRLHAGDFVLDIGANIGLFTMAAASLVGSSGRVVAVEPLPANHRSLYAGIVHNHFEQVSVMPFAASDRNGLISAICDRGSSNGIVGVRAGENGEEFNVPTYRLDDVLATLSRLDVVKIDIEGHEPLAWDGMQTLLQRYRPDVFSEFSPVAMHNVGNDALDYLARMFAYSDRITVLHRHTDPVECHSADAVMREWRQANRRARLQGELLLDVFIEG